MNKRSILKLSLIGIGIAVGGWTVANVIAMFISNVFWSGWPCESIKNQLYLWQPYKEVFWGKALALESLFENCR